MKKGDKAYIVFEVSETPEDRDGFWPEMTRVVDETGELWNVQTDRIKPFTFGMRDNASVESDTISEKIEESRLRATLFAIVALGAHGKGTQNYFIASAQSRCYAAICIAGSVSVATKFDHKNPKIAKYKQALESIAVMTSLSENSWKLINEVGKKALNE